ncbi:MAG: DUF547 domain-containing protein [Candidatus Omnitrophica bacterium]|nr:DUF547 domain-containing protein [Candidatus Omnitrophota bacterium]
MKIDAIKYIFLCFLCFLQVIFFPSSSIAFDHSKWDAFLKEFNHDGFIDYKAAKSRPELLDGYLADLASVSPEELASYRREETMALWINAYHAILVKIVLDHYPVKSVKDIPHFWDKAWYDVAGKSQSLDLIRREELMNRFKDERVHCALSYGSRGGPLLRKEAYLASMLEKQLTVDAICFVNDQARNEILPSKKRVRLCEIFKWSRRDFIVNFGTVDTFKNWTIEEMALLGFMAFYVDTDRKVSFLEGGSFKLQYLDFDWRLAEWQRK